MKIGEYSGMGLAIGVSIGTAIGVSTNNIGLWLPIGMCIGLALGTAFSSDEEFKSDKNEELKK